VTGGHWFASGTQCTRRLRESGDSNRQGLSFRRLVMGRAPITATAASLSPSRPRIHYQKHQLRDLESCPWPSLPCCREPLILMVLVPEIHHWTQRQRDCFHVLQSQGSVQTRPSPKDHKLHRHVVVLQNLQSKHLERPLRSSPPVDQADQERWRPRAISRRSQQEQQQEQHQEQNLRP